MQYIFLQKKTSSSWSLRLLTMPELTSFKAMQMRFLFFSSYKNALNDVSSGNFRRQKDDEDKVFFHENILNFVSKCTKHHKYAESIIAACAV